MKLLGTFGLGFETVVIQIRDADFGCGKAGPFPKGQGPVGRSAENGVAFEVIVEMDKGLGLITQNDSHLCRSPEPIDFGICF